MNKDLKNRMEELKKIYKDVRGYYTAATDTIVEVKSYAQEKFVSAKEYVKEKIWES